MLPFLMSFLFLGTQPSILTIPIAEAAPVYDFTSTTTVRSYILEQASTTPDLVEYVVKNESGYVYNQRGDLNITCKNKNSPYYGEPVMARGAFQITKCYHPEITNEQADDVIWATSWAIPRLKDKKTCMREWTRCAMYYAPSSGG